MILIFSRWLVRQRKEFRWWFPWFPYGFFLSPLWSPNGPWAASGYLNLSTRDPHLFLVVQVKQLKGEAGDCKVVRWPEEIPSFQAGRQCQLDGLVKGLNEALPYLTYRPPPDFFGHAQLQFMIFKTEVADSWFNYFITVLFFFFFFTLFFPWTVHFFLSQLGWKKCKTEDEIMGVNNNSRDSYQSILVDIEVLGRNDPPMLELFLDTYTVPEDRADYLVLGPLFVSDIDANDYPLSFRFELVTGHKDNMLMVCGLLGTLIGEPYNYTLDENECLQEGASLIQFNTTVQKLGRWTVWLLRGSLLYKNTVDVFPLFVTLSFSISYSIVASSSFSKSLTKPNIVSQEFQQHAVRARAPPIQSFQELARLNSDWEDVFFVGPLQATKIR